MIARRLFDIKKPEPSLLIVQRSGFIELIAKGRHAYPIENDRIDSAPKLLGWIHHLSKKGWVTCDHIKQLIEHAEANGIAVAHNT